MISENKPCRHKKQNDKISDAPAITFRHKRKKEFFVALAVNGVKAQEILAKAVDDYLESQRH